MHLHLLQASTEPHGCSKCHRKQLNHCTIQLASCVVIYSHVQLHQRSGEPITDNRRTCGCLTRLANQTQQKQTEQPLALIHTRFTKRGLIHAPFFKTHLLSPFNTDINPLTIHVVTYVHEAINCIFSQLQLRNYRFISTKVFPQPYYLAYQIGVLIIVKKLNMQFEVKDVKSKRRS